MLFKEVREYQPGDDIRFIDWNTSARFGHPFSKIFEEERELQVLFLVDLSASHLFGTLHQQKQELIIEMVSVLIFSAIHNQEKAGLLLFSNRIEKFIPPAKGKPHALRMIRELLSSASRNRGTALQEALDYFNRVAPRRSVCFLLSDFLDQDLTDSIKKMANRHDLIGIRVYDERERVLPNAGLWQLCDAETGATTLVDTADPFTRHHYTDSFNKHEEQLKDTFKNAGADLLYIKTGQDYVPILQQFFTSRLR